jgi:hypothetical protein
MAAIIVQENSCFIVQIWNLKITILSGIELSGFAQLLDGYCYSCYMKKRLVFAFTMGLFATCIISFVLVAVNLGFGPKFMFVWLRSWLIAYVIVIPLFLFVAPLVQLLISRWLKEQ